MSYSVKEVFPTFQGEGHWTGRRAIFLRLAGCNLWDGNPDHRDRGAGACARWCDTDFVGGGKFEPDRLAETVLEAWVDSGSPVAPGHRARDGMVVITGGEPTLQLKLDLVDELQARGFFIAVETNGTRHAPALDHVDWITFSPKLGTEIVLKRAHELKVVLPGHIDGVGWTDSMLETLEEAGTWIHRFVQPQDVINPAVVSASHLVMGPHLGVDRAEVTYLRNLERCLDFVARHPRWRLSAQVHKYINAR